MLSKFRQVASYLNKEEKEDDTFLCRLKKAHQSDKEQKQKCEFFLPGLKKFTY